MNKVFLYGNLTNQPISKVTSKGRDQSSFSVAVKSGFGQNEKTEFINCIAFGQTASFINNYLKKGSPILIEGRLSTYQGVNQNNENVYRVNVVVDQANSPKRAEGVVPNTQQNFENLNQNFEAIHPINEQPYNKTKSIEQSLDVADQNVWFDDDGDDIDE
ncbi:single-stranded DNA-binding protein [Ureaplasma canigenitalium]|uniref:single-stranded DNA-binding protein n=1 Tax=Ureaplasma canigenitalium TaxID=42092 RepID=UPI000690425B|nr:single-stranded DNA-binding protein [Ureaplasma canigenitalium]